MHGFCKNEGDSQVSNNNNRHARRSVIALFAISMLCVLATPLAAQELVLGEEKFEPGIVLIFEGAVRDHVLPTAQHLPEDETHVHIEGRANWSADEADLPPGTPTNGFVAYIEMHAQVTNEVTGATTFVTLTPHINLIDNMHYARNMTLPGSASDLYKVRFFVNPPDPFTLALHRDWLHDPKGGDRLFMPKIFTYENVSFVDIVNAPPRPSALQGDAVAQ